MAKKLTTRRKGTAKPDAAEELQETARAIGEPVSITPYALSAVALLLILTGAILTPDFLNYSLRVEELRASSSKAAQVPASTVVSSASPTTSAPVPTTATPAKVEDKKPALDSAQIFETYGKLLTMLLGFVSILGVFVGYFVRKSLREIQEDIYKDVEKRMNLWEEQKDMVLESLKETRVKFEGLTQLYDECKQVLETLKEATKAEMSARKPSSTSTENIVASLDADPTLDAPSHVTSN